MRSSLEVGSRAVWRAILPILKTPNFIWLITHPIIYLVYIPLWILAIINWDILLNYDIKWWILTKTIYFVLGYNLYSFYIVYHHWEDRMNDLFWKTVVLISFGIFIWTLLSFQAAF